MNCLRSPGRRDCGFEFYSARGCLVFVLCVRFSVFVYRQRPCDELIARPKLPTDCPTVYLLIEVKRKVSWRRPGP
jgi:hypothetical protein